jgi:periplasmic divalent cation tolerance protein
MTGIRLAISTAANRDEAERIAHALVEEHLAACVNIVNDVRSIYRWQGAVETADEVLLLIKTTVQNIDRLRTRLHELHSYELPEFLVFEVADGSRAYLEWIAASLH